MLYRLPTNPRYLRSIPFTIPKNSCSKFLLLLLRCLTLSQYNQQNKIKNKMEHKENKNSTPQWNKGHQVETSNFPLPYHGPWSFHPSLLLEHSLPPGSKTTPLLHSWRPLWPPHHPYHPSLSIKPYCLPLGLKRKRVRNRLVAWARSRLSLWCGRDRGEREKLEVWEGKRKKRLYPQNLTYRSWLELQTGHVRYYRMCFPNMKLGTKEVK